MIMNIKSHTYTYIHSHKLQVEISKVDGNEVSNFHFVYLYGL